MSEEKCKDCLAHQYDEKFGDMCIAPACIKDYEYDPETRTWTSKINVNILIGKEEEDLLKLMPKKELKKLEKDFEEMKSILDRLGRKETTDRDIKDFIKLIEHNIIKKILKELKWVDNKIMQISRDVATKKLINKYQKILKESEKIK